jgi:hypothetical protein
MISTFDISTTLRLKYCRRHQRAWVESLDQWVAFPERAIYGSPLTEAACDTCTACVPPTFGAVREQDAS